MRAVVQRVAAAHVVVGDQEVGRIGTGLLVLLGVGRHADPITARRLARRIVGLRIFDDEHGRMNRSVVDLGGQMLVVSQFTLWADVRSGRRPSWGRAAPAAQAEPLVGEFVRAVRALDVVVAEGRFGADMDVHSVHHGPVTVLFD